jgi:hypothetical protein
MPALTDTGLISITIGVVALILTAALLIWTRAARSAYMRDGVVVFGRGGGKLIGGAVVIALCAFAAPIIGFDGRGGLLWGVAIVAFFALIWWAQYLAPSLLFYVADQQALTRQWLAFRKSLPWNVIDWIYPERKTTTYRTYGVKTGQSTAYNLVVEAGPRRSIKIILKGWLIGGNPQPLLDAIQQRATFAEFGFDRAPVVQQHRNTRV